MRKKLIIRNRKKCIKIVIEKHSRASNVSVIYENRGGKIPGVNLIELFQLVIITI